MPAVPLIDPDFPPPAGSVLGLIGTVLKRAIIFAFVLWQLFFLAFRNPVDLWQEDFEKWAKSQSWWDANKPTWRRYEEDYFDPVSKATKAYSRVFAVEQGWSMFTPNLARRGRFLDARIDFSDGTEIDILSENQIHRYEIDDNKDGAYRPKPFLRFGGWRQRKLEDSLIDAEPDKIADADDLALYGPFVRWTVQHGNNAIRPTRASLSASSCCAASSTFPRSRKIRKIHSTSLYQTLRIRIITKSRRPRA